VEVFPVDNVVQFVPYFFLFVPKIQIMVQLSITVVKFSHEA